MNDIVKRLREYKLSNGLTIEALFLKLRDAGILLSQPALKNWLGGKNAPGQMYSSQIDKYLIQEGW